MILSRCICFIPGQAGLRRCWKLSTILPLEYGNRRSGKPATRKLTCKRLRQPQSHSFGGREAGAQAPRSIEACAIRRKSTCDGGQGGLT
jgi:hypothetical protein